MSAFLVSKKHIDYIVSAAHFWSKGNVGRYLPRDGGVRACDSIGRGKDPIPFEDFGNTDVGRLLWRENLISVAHRYARTDGDTRGSTIEIDAYKHAWVTDPSVTDGKGPDAVKVIKSIQCLEYQSCEHDGWESSAAHTFCQNLLSEAIRHLPGYDAAPWGIS